MSANSATPQEELGLRAHEKVIPVANTKESRIMSNPYEGDSTTSVPGTKGTNTTTGEESDERQTAAVRSSVTETEPSRKAADLRTEFDSPNFVGASAASSIAISHFEEAYRARPPWDIDGPQPDLARLLDVRLMQGRVLDIGCGTGENTLFLSWSSIRTHHEICAMRNVASRSEACRSS